MLARPAVTLFVLILTLYELTLTATTKMDALGEVTDTTIGVEGRSKVEARIRQLEGGSRLKETSNSSAAMSQV